MIVNKQLLYLFLSLFAGKLLMVSVTEFMESRGNIIAYLILKRP